MEALREALSFVRPFFWNNSLLSHGPTIPRSNAPVREWHRPCAHHNAITAPSRCALNSDESRDLAICPPLSTSGLHRCGICLAFSFVRATLCQLMPVDNLPATSLKLPSFFLLAHSANLTVQDLQARKEKDQHLFLELRPRLSICREQECSLRCLALLIASGTVAKVLLPSLG